MRNILVLPISNERIDLIKQEAAKEDLTVGKFINKIIDEYIKPSTVQNA